mmetsp:Transcript_30539/g.64788  ORF Transcript_30539/g.64788 Transcript_30539/m.64788 type:complete len:304 (-) Transcript_30539:92-1003(-)
MLVSVLVPLPSGMGADSVPGGSRGVWGVGLDALQALLHTKIVAGLPGDNPEALGLALALPHLEPGHPLHLLLESGVECQHRLHQSVVRGRLRDYLLILPVIQHLLQLAAQCSHGLEFLLVDQDRLLPGATAVLGLLLPLLYNVPGKLGQALGQVIPVAYRGLQLLLFRRQLQLLVVGNVTLEHIHAEKTFPVVIHRGDEEDRVLGRSRVFVRYLLLQGVANGGPYHPLRYIGDLHHDAPIMGSSLLLLHFRLSPVHQGRQRRGPPHIGSRIIRFGLQVGSNQGFHNGRDLLHSKGLNLLTLHH